MRSLICLFLMTLALASCDSKPQTRVKTQNEIEAEAYGRADADKVIKSRPQSMEREKAVLHIKVKENQIREAGDSLAAAAYANAAKARLDSAGVF